MRRQPQKSSEVAFHKHVSAVSKLFSAIRTSAVNSISLIFHTLTLCVTKMKFAGSEDSRVAISVFAEVNRIGPRRHIRKLDLTAYFLHRLLQESGSSSTNKPVISLFNYDLEFVLGSSSLTLVNINSALTSGLKKSSTRISHSSGMT